MGVTVREAGLSDAAGIARVHVDSWRTTYPGIMPEEFLASLSYDERERMWRRVLSTAAERGQVVYVAEDGAGWIVGFAYGGPTRGEAASEYAGEVYSIYLLQSQQGQGLGRQLFRRVAQYLAGQGRKSLLVWVARDNPSRRFYEALGGKPAREQQIELSGQTIDEVGYGWDDVAPLLARRTA